MYNILTFINNIKVDNMIKDIMSKKIVSCKSDSSIKDASKLMKENNIGFIPIKDDKKFVGVITDRDICLSLSCINELNCPIKDYMTKQVISIDIDSRIEDALKLMSKHKIKRLLVKENDDIVGILSLSDILNYTNQESLISTFKTIFSLKNNRKENTSEIDEFYL